MVKIFKNVLEIQAFVEQKHRENGSKTIGFVPTMGALHEGHMSLIRESNRNHSITICSIFVNPTQFNRSEDFEKYPRMVEKDLILLDSVGCAAVFIPDVKEIYPLGQENHRIAMDLGSLGKILEARFRPGHFEGVVQVVYRLFEIIMPDVAYFGKKDYQQCKVVELLAKTYFPMITIKTLPTLRESDGLAMSSRNLRLTEKGRKSAVNIYKALKEAESLYQSKENIKKISEHVIQKYFTPYGLQCEYFVFCNRENLSELNIHEKDAVILTAVWVDGIRLIDNLEINLF